MERVEKHGGTTESMMVRVIGLAGIPSRWNFVELGVFRFNNNNIPGSLSTNSPTAQTDRCDHGHKLR